MHISEYDYHLPEDLIAQKPVEQRDESRLMVLNKDNKTIEHHVFKEVIDYINEGDCLVLNNSKVIPARLFGKKVGTGANIEFLLIKRIKGDLWETMARPGKKVKVGDRVSFSEDFLMEAVVVAINPDGTRQVEFSYEGIFEERLDDIGHLPLPPYIKREDGVEDKNRYQTVYSEVDGSVAAPTAGLHFTDDLLDAIRAKGVKIAYVTLHVGIGTFRPVKVENVLEHEMHFESYHVSQENADIINETKASGNRIIAVGTTSVRTMESAAQKTGKVVCGGGDTNLFIYPGYKFNVIDAMVTNFHLPKSTLLMLVSAFYEKEEIFKAYKTAVEEKYRFFSYGDAMIIF